MKTESEKTNFDLSILSLDELIKLYEDITDFGHFLEEKRIVIDKVDDKNE